MSTMLEEVSESQNTPRSSKKRKHASEGKESSSKKRRKQAELEVVADTNNSQESPVRADGRKKKNRPREDSAEAIQAEQTTTPRPQRQGDTELPDAPTIHDEVNVDEENINVEDLATQPGLNLDSQEPTCFHSTRISLYLPIPPIALSSASPSILSQHLAPLLLTYYAPAGGIILSFSDPVLSARPESGLNLPLKPPRKGKIPKNPPDETFSLVGDEFGSCWVWLTATFLVFRPQPGNKLSGWTNVTSEGFVGLVSYNYFQTAVGKSRIPKSWRWNGPVREKARGRKKPRKGRLNDSQDANDGADDNHEMEDIPMREDDAIDGNAGSFLDADGRSVSETLTFRVVDIEMVPAHERNKWSLQIDGSLLNEEEERTVREEERQKFESLQHRSRSRSRTPGTPLMSGGLAPGSRAVSVASST